MFSEYSVLDQYIHKTHPLRIVIVGAGLTGIAAVHKLDNKFKDLDITYQIYEKNHDVGGTWLENRYPGCACDVPAHSVSSPPACYQYDCFSPPRVMCHKLCRGRPNSLYSTPIPGKAILNGADSTLEVKRSGRTINLSPTNTVSIIILNSIPASSLLLGIMNCISMNWRSKTRNRGGSIRIVQRCLSMPLGG